MLVFPRENTRIHTKMGEIHELFVLPFSLVWFAGATPDAKVLALSATKVVAGKPDPPAGTLLDFLLRGRHSLLDDGLGFLYGASESLSTGVWCVPGFGAGFEIALETSKLQKQAENPGKGHFYFLRQTLVCAKPGLKEI